MTATIRRPLGTCSARSVRAVGRVSGAPGNCQPSALKAGDDARRVSGRPRPIRYVK